MSKLLDKLKRLYELSKIRPEEENDEARLNEARNASFLLLKLARENGVQVKFVVMRETHDEPKVESPFQGTGYASSSKTWKYGAQSQKDWDDFFDIFDINMHAATARGHARSRQPTDKFRYPPGSTRPRAESRNGALLITSQFAGRCKKCHRTYAMGETVWWVKDIGCTHEKCGYEVLIADETG